MGFIDTIGETAFRLTAFIGIFVAMALLEIAIPMRALGHSKWRRWFTNLAIVGIDGLVVRLMALLAVPVAAVAAAVWAETQGWGLLNRLAWPGWLEAGLALVVLDLAIYAQHVAFHKVPALWRLHKVHHVDVDIDVTTGLRFHPVEIALSMAWKIVVVLALGASALSVVLFEVILNGCSMFNHANIALPGWLDRAIRTLVVTPDMHRVHHSVIHRETESNYGFNLSVWDRLFRTYTPQPKHGHTGMTVGQKDHLNEDPTRLGWSLLLPLSEPPQRPGARRRAEDGRTRGAQKKLSGK